MSPVTVFLGSLPGFDGDIEGFLVDSIWRIGWVERVEWMERRGKGGCMGWRMKEGVVEGGCCRSGVN